MNFDLKQKLLIIASTFFLLLVVLIYFIIIPTIKDINSLATKIGDQRYEVERKYQQSQGFKKEFGNLIKIEPEINKLNQVFISKNRELEFITSLEDIAAKNNVAQKINLVYEKNTEQIYQKNTLQLATATNFKNQINYLSNLETLSYYINIKSLSLSINQIPSAKNENNEKGLNMSIIADTYWR
jgi:lipopolysaccharide export LptBFGC system permease protein LptF